MPRELREAPAMAPPTASVATSFFASIILFVKQNELETKVMTAWFVWCILRHLQSILGPMRRRSRHSFIQYGAMAAYYLPTLVLFYTANAVYSSDSDIKVFISIGCLVLLVVSARGTVTMTAFTLGGGTMKLESWRVLPWLIYFAWLQWRLIILLDSKLTISDLCYLIVFCVVPLICVVRPKPGEDTLEYETKVFADHMVIESRSSPSPFFDHHSGHLYNRCRYPFNLKPAKVESDDRWINFSDVLKWIGWLRVEPDDRWINFNDVLKWSSRQGLTEDQDIWLAYSFCRLLARRYFGFPCPEDGNAQVRDFVLRELLAADKAFTIVEVQLAFLHDYFFTNYYSKITSGVLTVTQGVVGMWRLPLVYVCSYIVVSFLNNKDLSALLHEDLPYICILAVVGLLVYTVIMQPRHPVLPTYWHPIQKLFRDYYYPTDDTGGPAVVNISSASTRSSQSSGTTSYYWRNKMGQYSVMDDYNRRRSPKKAFIAFIAWSKVLLLSQVSYSFIKHHPVAEEDVSIPDAVKRSVARTIQGMNGLPTMGTRLLLLLRDGTQEDLSWTCRQDTLTHTILIWHVATCYCDMSQPQAHSIEELSTINRKVATTLSKYCANLVAFLPELLPEHSLNAKVVLQQVLMEAQDLLASGQQHISMEEKRRRIQQLDLREDVSGMQTFKKGLLLGRQLERQSISLCWKTMSDFWAETILYIASSSKNSAAHIQQLAQGGEFVTHLWALLCNAGIQSG